MQEHSGLILDCDGTLMDTIGAWHEAETSLLSEAGVVLTKEERDELNALTLEEAGEFFHGRFGLRASAGDVVGSILEYLLNFYRTRSEANPGALKLVKSASEAGVPMAVLSSSPQSFLQAGMQRGGFAPYIEHVISVEDLAWTKRDEATYDYVCKLLGVKRSRAWLFDDSWYALRTAQAAGLRTVGVFSSDSCGTHEELARYSDRVIDAFTEVTLADFM